MIKDKSKCSDVGAQLNCERAIENEYKPYKIVSYYLRTNGWPEEFKSEQCKGKTIADQFVISLQDDKLRAQIKLAEYKMKSLATRHLNYFRPAKEYVYGSMQTPLPNDAIGPFSEADTTNEAFTDLQKIPIRDIAWTYKTEGSHYNGLPDAFYTTIECIKARSSELPDAKYILTLKGGGGMVKGKNFMTMSMDQQVFSEFELLPTWFTEACKKHLDSTTPQIGLFKQGSLSNAVVPVSADEKLKKSK